MTARWALVACAVFVAACSGPAAITEPSTSLSSSGQPEPTVTSAQPSPEPTVAPSTSSPTPTVATGDKDLAYGPEPLQRLDLFLPDGPGPHPLLLWFHGGGWVVGDKSDLPFRDLVDRGIAVASANYRGALDVYPALFEDPGTALSWLVERSDDFDLDVDRVVVGGFSAGAHLAALTVLTTHVPVAGLVGFAGPYDLRDLTNVPGNGGIGATALLALMLDCPIEDCPDRLEAVSPIVQVTGDAPPVLLQAGTADPVVDARSSESLATELEAAGVDVALELIDGGGHRVIRTDAVDAFLSRLLLGP